MTPLFALAPTMIVIAPVMLTLCLVARRLSQGEAQRIAFVRLSRMAAVLTVLAALPMVTVMAQAGGIPASFQEAFADHAFSMMGSTIVR